MKNGELVLFTGAGFSAEAISVAGTKVPVGAALRETLWQFAYPGEPFEESSALGDLYQIAVRRAQNRLGDELRRILTVNHSELPDFYRIWFATPWRTIYTLNLDDIAEAAVRRFRLPVPITSISAISDETLPVGGQLMSVHLNGRISDFPKVTFSDVQYGERTALPDAWYRHLSADLSAFSVVFVGTVLDEPPLWQQVAVRRLRERRSKELRPRSFLVTPTLSRPRQDVLAELNIDWVPMTAKEFAEEVLLQMQPSAEEGQRYLASVRSPHPAAALLSPVSELLTETRADLADYLMGREPSWADVTEGFAVVRQFEKGLVDRIRSENARIVIISGTAGTGKSTTLLRLAIALQASGRSGRYLDIDTELSIQRVRSQIRQLDADFLVIDDVDVFGTSAGPLLADMCDENPKLVILVGIRSTRLDTLDVRASLTDFGSLVVDVPSLADSDIDSLIEALTRANRLGALRGLPDIQQRRVFERKAGRQLLVAMIEATSDERFDHKIRSECAELSNGEQFVYAVVALATRFRQFVRRDEVLIAVGADSSDAIADIESLVRKQILIRGELGDLVVRHRVIAEEALRFFKEQGVYSYVVEGLLFTMALKAGGPEQSPHTREHRLLVRLLSRQFLLQEIVNGQRIREVYASVEDVLSWDFHFWLQRGAFELELNNLEGAEMFLSQARGLAPDDYRVQTEWAYMLLKKACRLAEAGDNRAPALAEEGFADLYDVIWKRGKQDSYPYHVLGSQGLSWSRRATLPALDRTALLNNLLQTVREGRKHHPRNRELELLDSDLYVAYLASAN